MSSLDLINAVLYVAENACTLRALPRECAHWHTIDTPLTRWGDKGACLSFKRIKNSLKFLSHALKSTEQASTFATDGADALRKTAPKPPANYATNGQQKFIGVPQPTWIDLPLPEERG